MKVTPKAKLEFVRNLGPDWKSLAFYLGIPEGDQGRIQSAYPGEQGIGIWRWLEYHKALDRLEGALKDVRPDLLKCFAEEINQDAAGTDGWRGSPYTGLESLKPHHAPIFFGRRREADALATRLVGGPERFLAVIGDSGSGKSSLVYAGVIGGLLRERPAAWHWVDCTPGTVAKEDNDRDRDPFLALATSLHSAFKVHPIGVPDWYQALREGGALPETLGKAGIGKGNDHELLIFVDQFEELFTQVAVPNRDPFMRLMCRLADTPGVRTIVTLRVDFLEPCANCEPFRDLLNRSLYTLGRPSPLALYQMIIGPAQQAGLNWLPEQTPERILRDVGDQPGALALMALALSELYEQRQAAGHLTQTAYESFGGVQGIIGTLADRAFNALSAGAQESLNGVFAELVEVDSERRLRTRRSVPRSRFATPAQSEIIETFAAREHRLLVISSKGPGPPMVEVAHEALLVSWPRLNAWIEERFDDLHQVHLMARAAEEWRQSAQGRESGPDDRHLWKHERQELVRPAIQRLKRQLSPVEQAFMQPEALRLADKLDAPHLDHRARERFGREMAEIGDLRDGVGLDEAGLPKFKWLRVPAGKITLDGGRPEQAGPFEVAAFEISQYPVTWGQYDAFLEASDGFGNPEWWQGLAKRSETPGERRWDYANYPAIYVSWSDAVAFCRWLSHRSGQEIRLPTEWEWQQAATGGKVGYEYPWGAEWGEAKANTYESSINRTTAVGLYPAGASPVGALDMSGNVWEWCLNEFETPERTELDGDKSRVVRGGAWASSRRDARASYRDVNHPGYRLNGLGFRVVRVSPIFE